MDFAVDTHALLITLGFGVVFFLAWLYLRRWHKPYLYYSRINYFSSDNVSIRQRLSLLPKFLQVLALILFLIAFTDPHGYKEKVEDGGNNTPPSRIPTEGIGIYLVLDNSRSMGEELEIPTPSGRRKKISKMQVLKEVTEQFVRGDPNQNLKGRPNDLLGIVAFARSAQILAPLTLDHRDIIRHLRALDINRDESQLGTAMGYSIYKTANLIRATRHFGQDTVKSGKPAYEIKNSVILLITDGFQETHPDDYTNPLRSMDLVDAVNEVKELGITLYLINIDPKITSEKYADHRKYFSLLTELTGGKFYYVDGSRDLHDIYSEIDQLEKSELPQHTKEDKQNLPHIYERVSYYKEFIFSGMVSLFISVILMTTLLRRVP